MITYNRVRKERQTYLLLRDKYTIYSYLEPGAAKVYREFKRSPPVVVTQGGVRVALLLECIFCGVSRMRNATRN